MKTNNSTAPFEHLGFIGLGNMGGAIALRLLRAGYPLTVLDLDADKIKPLVAKARAARLHREKLPTSLPSSWRRCSRLMLKKSPAAKTASLTRKRTAWCLSI